MQRDFWLSFQINFIQNLKILFDSQKNIKSFSTAGFSFTLQRSKIRILPMEWLSQTSPKTFQMDTLAIQDNVLSWMTKA